MRVGVIGPVGSERFAENIADALQAMGHQVTQLGPARDRDRGRLGTRVIGLALQAMPRIEERSQLHIAKLALDAGCEVVINSDPYLMPAVVSRLGRNGVRVAFWFPDPVTSLGRGLMLLAPYDAFFFKEPHLVERLRATLGLPVHYLPEACNPRWHRPVVPAGTEPYLVVAGNMYASRVRLLGRLIEKGIPLKLYGPSFPAGLARPLLAVRTPAARSITKKRPECSVRPSES